MSQALAVVLVAMPLGCGSGDDSGAAASSLTVFAASSLTEALADLERDFEQEHPEVDVVVAYAGSQVLALQIAQGAAADVFLSADRRHMGALFEGRSVRAPEVFAHNELVVIVPQQNPAQLESFADLARASRVVLGDENVPVGAYAREVLRKAAAAQGDGFAQAVSARVVSTEANVRLVRAKVEMGEADAALVYRTDATASQRVRWLPIPAELNVRAEYLAAAVAGSAEPTLAADFIGFLRSARGQAVLQQRGFLPAP